MVRTTDISARDPSERLADDAVWWPDSEEIEPLIRVGCADASLQEELDALLPDTVAEL